jgi:hypothetical protein
MAVYQPPKRNSTGDTLSAGGSGLMTLGSTLTATGIGAVPGAIIAGIGGIASLFGASAKKKEEERQLAYQEDYQNQIVGEKNQLASSEQVSEQNRMMYTQEGVSQSLKSINQMVNPSNQVPSGGGTGIINQRLT